MSKIEWTDETWNPVAGCSKVSPGCRNCYAERMARRQVTMGNRKYFGTVDASGWTGEVNIDIDTILEPLKWKKPRMIFVESMSDLFYGNMRSIWLDLIFDTIKRCPQHTFQILTKRPERMKEYIESLKKRFDYRVPFKNVWLGVSVESQDYVSRIETLLEIPAVVRFVSLEPLLGPVDISKYLYADCPVCRGSGITESVTCGNIQLYKVDCPNCKLDRGRDPNHLDWVIVGGETGPGARPMNPEWARSIRYQCHKACVPFFFKGIGGVRKKKNSKFLDGKRWEQFPEVRK